ncbi:MAG: type II toxin-antitoxin system HipA family toxin [Myxococcales bacterium]|nr:type II toxin-antitoxin system HipA family toxin [Myxococcales bacterium]
MTKILEVGDARGDPSRALLELYTDGAWRPVGAVRVRDPRAGIASPGAFEYDFDYLDAHPGALGARDRRAVSCRYPVGYDTFEEERWPPFLLDLIPSGAARRHWEQRLGLPNTDSSDWRVLVAGASHPPGNIRVATALEREAESPPHPGFPRSDILDRAAGFIEYAHKCGAPVSGSTGAGGDSPKFLLREDHEGRWHAEGALTDERTSRCWLVKFPGGRRELSDRIILEAEAAYHRVAARFGARTFGEVVWERDCLFVPRFDRVIESGRIDCLGLESLCSLAGIAEFGAAVPKERLAAAIAAQVEDPATELREFVLRDVLDVALGNTDNHSRNTAVLKGGDGRVALSPLYDFAPMILDNRGIARVCRWADRADYPRWDTVADAVAALEAGTIKQWLRDLAEPVSGLAELMRECGVPEMVVEHCTDRVARVARALAAVRP